MQLEEVFKAVLEGQTQVAKDGVKRALEDGLPASRILNEALIPAMDEVGRKYETGEYYVPELLVAARAMQAGLSILLPLLANADTPTERKSARILLGTVQGDLHDIGKNLVRILLEGAGFEVVDLGVDVSPERFVSAVQELKPDLLAMSALLTTTMPAMFRTIRSLDQAGLHSRVKVLVGGAPLTQAYADQIGADGYGADAAAAVRIARGLTSREAVSG